MENNLKFQLEQTMKGVQGLMKVANDKLIEARNMANTDEEKKQFTKEFVESGLLKEFDNLKSKISDLSK
jgi:hypothetical protein